MKKLIALVLAGAMVCAMPVMAAGSPSASSVPTTPAVAPSAPAAAIVATEPAPAATEETPAVSVSVQEAAAENNQSVAEYMNNAVSSLPGVTDVTPMAPDVVMINGAASRAVKLAKPNNAVVSTAKTHAANLGGNLMNVIIVKSSAKFQTAQINMLTMGVKAGDNIKVYQMVNGQLVELKVLEIRQDHVVFDITGPGTIMFVKF